MIIHRSQLHAVTAADDDTRYMLNSVGILPDGRVCGTNGHYLISIGLPENVPGADCYADAMADAVASPALPGHTTIIPAAAVKQLMAGSKPANRYDTEQGFIGIVPSNGAAGVARLTNGATFPAADPANAVYPAVDRVIPPPAENHTVTLDPVYLRDLCDAAIKWRKDTGNKTAFGLKFTIKDANNAIRIECDEFLAVLMPRRD
jgi:hypothetical protein